MIKEHFPLASLVAIGLPLALGDGALFIMSLTAVIASLPLVYGSDVDDVVQATVARNVLKGYRPHEGNWPTEYLPAKRQAAWEAFEPRFVEDPQLREMAEGYAAYIAKKG